jgi:hypothetical protein
VEHEYGEFSHISQFWKQCEINYVDELFFSFNIDIILSARRKQKEDIDFQFRKEVLLYCCRITTPEQKERLIHDIEKDFDDKKLSEDEQYEIIIFLAALGNEESIMKIIDSYILGKPVPNRMRYDHYPLGFLEKSFRLLKRFIELYNYSMEESNERRHILLNIAQDGIKQHISKKSFWHFKCRILQKIKTYQKTNSWFAENCKEFLLQIEQDYL